MTIRVFAGCAPDALDAESMAVFEWSLRKHASEPVELEWMQLSRDPESPWFSDPSRDRGWNTRDWVTPFSGFRWAVPWRCGFEGRAIYSDPDVIWMADVAELAYQNIPTGASVLAKAGKSWRLCVSLWDCAAAREHVLPIEELRRDFRAHYRMGIRMFATPGWVAPFEGNWNCVDGEGLSIEDPSVKAIHYSAISNQLHLKHALPRLAAAGKRHWYDGPVEAHWRADLQELFDVLLAEAGANGFSPLRYVQQAQASPYGEINKRPLTNYRTGARA